MNPDSQNFGAFMAAMLAVYAVVIVIVLVIVIIPTWFICKKAGFSPWLSLLNVIPFGGLILLYVLAFAQWKVIPAPVQAWIPPQPPYTPPQA